MFTIDGDSAIRIEILYDTIIIVFKTFMSSCRLMLPVFLVIEMVVL